MSDSRVGVFICDCGERIASVLDTGALARVVRLWPEVALARRLPYACSPDGLEAIRQAIREGRLDRVVVAGCTPRMLAPRLQRACEEAGLEGSGFDLVDIREGCAWVHQDEPEAAMAKALDLIRMGVARVALRRLHEAATAKVVPAALVIGGGPAGLTAALTLAKAGVPVKLVEREAVLGGLLRRAHTLPPNRRCAASYLAARLQAVAGCSMPRRGHANCVHDVRGRHEQQPRIEVLLQSEVTAVTGSVGRYTITVSTHGEPLRSTTFDVGAIVVASGAAYPLPHGLYRYDGRRVVTQLEFEQEIRSWEPCACREGIEPPGSVVMLLCAGQRDESVPYCSGVCCLAGLKQALEVKAANPAAGVTVVCRDLCAPEEEVRRAQQAGVEFVHYAPGPLPSVTGEAVEVFDESTDQKRRLPYDRLVLATPLVPQPDAAALAHRLGIAQDAHGFFPEVRQRLRPGSYAERGIYVCGAAHGPTGWAEAEFQAAAAAFRAVRHIGAGQAVSHAPAARVDDTLCTGCGQCAASCPFGAITLHKRAGVLSLSQVDPLLCVGCGNCVVTCPARAIDLPVGGEAEMLAQIEAALASPAPAGQVRILALGCEWSGHAAAELAGARKLSYPPEVRLIRVACSARFDPIHVLWAWHNGADGVFLGGCPPGQCHYTDGNRYAQERIATLEGLLAAGGFDPRRLRLEWITPDDPGDLVDKITAFTELVRALGPSPLRSAALEKADLEITLSIADERR